jgi:glycosyltransferase involved in cell wall biosynthesis
MNEAAETSVGLVTTIIPVYNRPGMLREAVASVVRQTYRPIEIIIVDDGSTDETARVAEELASTNPFEVRTLHVLNGGPGWAREAGRHAARGEFIQYLDSDDLLLPRKFELQVSGLRMHLECGVAYGRTHTCVYGEAPDKRAWKRTGEQIETMFPSMLQSRWWATSTPLYRRVVLDQAGAWSHLKAEEDWEYDCRVACQGIRLHFCQEAVSIERAHSGSCLSRGGSRDPEKLFDRAEAHRLILGHARRAGVSSDSAEMQHFARELFLLARQCGAAGLPGEAKRLFGLAREASGPERACGIDFLAYRVAAGVLGWTLAGRAACRLDALKS